MQANRGKASAAAAAGSAAQPAPPPVRKGVFISLYREFPDITLPVRDFKDYAIARLKVLKDIERIYSLDATDLDASDDADMSNYGQMVRQREDKVMKSLYEHGLAVEDPNGPLSTERAKECDEHSHFTLRLAFCESSEKQNWFVSQEVHMLKAKLGSSSAVTANFLLREGIRYHSMEWNDIPDGLRLDIYDVSPGKKDQRFYQVPWEAAASLVARRKVVLRRGVAFVAEEDLKTIIANRYRQFLLAQLKCLQNSRHIVEVHNDPRFGSFVKNLKNIYLGPDPSAFSPEEQHVERLTPHNIDKVVPRSFPPCMRRLMEGLRSERHLKHWGRLQIWLFLKGAGMSMEEELSYFKQNMTLKATAFDKEHAYHIKHIYGKVGHMKSKPPYGCAKLMSGDAPPNPGPGDYHGCPFKHFDPGPLSQLMRRYNVPDGSTKKILDLVKGHHYQLGCVEYFRATHPDSAADGVGNHPNAFYTESCKYWGAKSGDGKVKKEEGGPADMDVDQEGASSSSAPAAAAAAASAAPAGGDTH
ncbi:unnamed protein product [Vitrella brassicaformis CCMP3155]|uniref:DNA primase large subunit C-terminal domain-containing protein n=2 Tax=Vitrella brassicaformis TaxID=1169539 RepID=A0A0G4F7N0_VITBC|nr:unnamed protein product [Vitrella brassicaformis CCMP3155]|mmetsp:Transcript_17409/g.41839  ORF Transcript_17409/g.41839 Transcript_17409/m.41839 type:complete len:528 (+) Transcript_17409:44-1627(+)|eukprot:CEM08113.1 unnamed protein product [Vitrella brassicaformis CCMP3155]